MEIIQPKAPSKGRGFHWLKIGVVLAAVVGTVLLVLPLSPWSSGFAHRQTTSINCHPADSLGLPSRWMTPAVGRCYSRYRIVSYDGAQLHMERLDGGQSKAVIGEPVARLAAMPRVASSNIK